MIYTECEKQEINGMTQIISKDGYLSACDYTVPQWVKILVVVKQDL